MSVTMSSIGKVAQAFFEACETGQGWAGCAPYCTPGATFSAQADALAEVRTLEAYADWMQGVCAILPDARYDLKAWAVDEERQAVVAYAVFHGTHTGEGGPVPPTGRSVSTDYVYVMEFERDRIGHLTKVWHDGIALRELGWG